MCMLKWDELPQEMQLSEVKPYYQLVSRRKGSLIFKRCLDLFLAVVLLILTSPLFLILSIWIKLDSKGPVIYKQVRGNPSTTAISRFGNSGLW